jgi:hypothetical protein
MSDEKKLGRPSHYKEEYCEKIIEYFREGMSIEEICYELNIAKQTFYNWCENYPEFKQAKNIGVDLSCGWWKKQGRKQLENKDFSYTGWYMNMKNRFGWADKQETKEEKSSEVRIIIDKDSNDNIEDFLKQHE